jgi:UDP-3-O-[3-hydroxymyristoyl] glucosamine N-acyltransferase
MGINKNFVVKNGFEASTDLILADADTRKVGVGTTNPQYTLDVAGGIGATDFYLTGIGTFVDELNVGLGGTVLTVLGLGNSIGIGTALPGYLLDIRSPVSTGKTALYVRGDVEITGDIRADDIFIDNAEIEDLIVTDTFLVVGLSTFSSNVFINASLNVLGLTTLGNYVDINSSVDIADDLSVVGLSTLGGYVDINNSVYISNDLNVVGLTTLGGYVDINNSVGISSDLSVSGIATIATADINAGEIDVIRIETGDLNVTGIATIATADINAGEIDVIRIETGDLNVTGIATIATISVVGAELSNLNVTGIATLGGYVDINDSVDIADDLNVVGLSTLGGYVDINDSVDVASNLNVVGLTTLGSYVTINDSVGISSDLSVSGITTLGGYVDINDSVGISSDLSVSGIATIATISVVSAELSNLNVTGIATLGVIDTTNLTLQNLEVSGITTLGSVEINSGIITAKSGIVTYFGDGSGLINTPPGNPAGSNTEVQYNDNGVFAGSSNFTFDGNNVNISGIVTASTFFGDGSGLTGTGSTVFNDTATNQEFFPLFTNITTGTITASGISTSKLTYNPSTGTLTVIDLNSTSDINLKENIKTVENAIETVSSLRGVSFDWKENGKSSYGVIAQELEEVLPELVKQGEVKSVNYNGLIGVLIEAVKELSAEVEELKKSLNN